MKKKINKKIQEKDKNVADGDALSHKEEKNSDVTKETEKVISEEAKNQEEKEEKEEKDLVDYKDKYTRILAEYSNYVKQKEIELQSAIRFANRNLLLKVIDVLDDIEAGLAQESVTEETKNILNILKIKILQILAIEGVSEIELAVGDDFDSQKAEVINVVEDKQNSGKIIQILRKGYTLSDKILRTAKVVVGK